MDMSFEPSWWSRNTGDEDDESSFDQSNSQSNKRAEIEHQAIAQRKHFIDNFRFHSIDQSSQSDLQCQTIVWSTDAFTSSFIQSTFRSMKHIGWFGQPNEQSNKQLINQTNYDHIQVYRVQDSLILLSYMEIDQSMMQPIVQSINQTINPQHCIVLDTQPAQSFVDLSNSSVTDADDVLPPLMRYIATSNYEQSINQSINQSIKPLTVPMMLHSLTAAILSEAEIKSLTSQSNSQSIAYINFYSQHYVNESLIGLINIFQSNNTLKQIFDVQSINQSTDLLTAANAWKKARSALNDFIRRKMIKQSNNPSIPGAGFGLGVSNILAETSSDLFL